MTRTSENIEKIRKRVRWSTVVPGGMVVVVVDVTNPIWTVFTWEAVTTCLLKVWPGAHGPATTTRWDSRRWRSNRINANDRITNDLNVPVYLENELNKAQCCWLFIAVTYHKCKKLTSLKPIVYKGDAMISLH